VLLRVEHTTVPVLLSVPVFVMLLTEILGVPLKPVAVPLKAPVKLLAVTLLRFDILRPEKLK
jgi:hypothetical protein